MKIDLWLKKEHKLSLWLLIDEKKQDHFAANINTSKQTEGSSDTCSYACLNMRLYCWLERIIIQVYSYFYSKKTGTINRNHHSLNIDNSQVRRTQAVVSEGTTKKVTTLINDKTKLHMLSRHILFVVFILQQSIRPTSKKTRLLNNEQQFCLHTSQRRRETRKCEMRLREIKHQNEMIVARGSTKTGFDRLFRYNRQFFFNTHCNRFLILTTLRA
jgi:hypothetical protein